MLSWFFTDRETGTITVAQFPNTALWIFLAALALRLLLPEGDLAAGVGLVGTAALAWWAGDEIIRGVNPWRRTLGGGVMLVIATSILGIR